MHKLNIVFFQSPDADLMVRPAEVRRLESKGQNRNELHESESWSKACCVSVNEHHEDTAAAWSWSFGWRCFLVIEMGSDIFYSIAGQKRAGALEAFCTQILVLPLSRFINTAKL